MCMGLAKRKREREKRDKVSGGCTETQKKDLGRGKHQRDERGEMRKKE